MTYQRLTYYICYFWVFIVFICRCCKFHEILVCFVHYRNPVQITVPGIIIMPGYLLNERMKEDKGMLHENRQNAEGVGKTRGLLLAGKSKKH